MTSGFPSGNEAMSKLKKVKRILEVTATVIAVALVIIEKFEK
jgi:hypothetical protein